MSEIPADIFIEAMIQNDLDAVEQLARVLCRRDDLDPDSSISIKMPTDKVVPPAMRAWMWYVDKAQEMLKEPE